MDCADSRFEQHIRGAAGFGLAGGCILQAVTYSGVHNI